MSFLLVRSKLLVRGSVSSAAGAKAGLLLVLLLLGGSAMPAQASHYRSGTLSWRPTGAPGQVQFNLTVTFRRDDSDFAGTAPDGFAQTNDIVTDTIGGTQFFFGDGEATDTLRFRVSAFSVNENYIIGEALNPGTDNVGILHTYVGAGPFTAGIDSAARVAELNNRAGEAYRLETFVTPQSGNSSPVSLIVPIVRVAQGSAANPAKFIVPASDPNGDTLRFRVSTDEEAGGGSSPPNLTVNPNTGEVSWDNAGLDTILPYTVQIVVEDLDGNGNVKTKTPVDFLLLIGDVVGTAPTLQINPAGPITVAPGSLVTFTVQASDVDAGAMVTLNSAGLPAGATTTPSLPVTSPSSASVVFNWTPTNAQVGTYVILFSATDETGQQTLRSITINVGGTTPPPVTGSYGAVTGNGKLSVVPVVGQARALANNKRTITTSFSGFSSRRGRTHGSVIYTDRINGIYLRATEITSVQINGNVGTISGIARVNGINGYSFVLTAIDNMPTYSVVGDGFSLQISDGVDFFNINSTFAPGGVRVISTGGTIVLPTVK
jgi:hypothetical protein